LASVSLDRPPAAPARTARAVRLGPPLRFAAALAPLAGALAVWAASLHRIEIRHLDRYGLPPALPASWYVAVALAITGATVATWGVRRPNGALIAAYVLGVVVILFATVPAITDVPHYPWVYKHIGVARFLGVHHRVDIAVDIYNRWPGFFALSAVFSRLAGLDPLSYAAWAEPFFAIVETLLVAGVARAISRDIRVAGYASLIFALGNWIGQSYFAPQAAAFAIALALLLVFARSFTGGRLLPPLVTLVQWVVRRSQPTLALAAPLPWSRFASAAVVLVLDAAIVVTHQLTPYVLLLQLGALVVLGVARPRWIVVAMAVLTVAYLVLNLDYVQHNFKLFTSLNPASNIQHGDSTPAHLDWFHANAGGLLSLELVVLMLASALRLARLGQGRRAVPLVVLAIAPFGILFAQNYGGEASLRVFLFSSPWRDVLVALGIQTFARRRVRFVASLAVCLTLTYMFVPAFYGAEGENIIPAGEVRASDYFFAHAPAGSVLMLAAPDFPTRAGARYWLMKGPQVDDGPNVAGNPEFQDRRLGPRQIPGLVALIHQYSRHGYLVFSTTGYRYTADHLLTPPGELAHLEQAVARSRAFRLWYRTRDARIYRLLR
jgi:hypothetical protein